MSDRLHSRITFGDVTIDDLLVSSLGENRYRLEEAPLLADSVFYGDVIEAHHQSDGSLLFTKVLERSGMRHYDSFCNARFLNQKSLKRCLER